MASPIRVLIIDGSPVYRDLLKQSLSGFSDIEVVGTTVNHNTGRKKIAILRPDIIILDIEMPDYHPPEYTHDLLREYPNLGIILASKSNSRAAELTIHTLEEGAHDFVIKPETRSESEKEIIEILKSQLPQKLRTFSIKRYSSIIKGLSRPDPAIKSVPSAGKLPSVKPMTVRPIPIGPAVTISEKSPPIKNQLEPLSNLWEKPVISKFDALLIGASTGGPEALSYLLPSFPNNFPIPIVIVLHMPEYFTEHLAKSLDRKSNLRVREIKSTTTLSPGYVYIAKGGKHLVFLKSSGRDLTVTLNNDPPEKSCKPSIDVTFKSAVTTLKKNLMALLMTGMGEDGTEGMKTLKDNGAHTIAQDESTSVVWGIPGNAVRAGCIDEILPIGRIATRICELSGLKRTSSYSIQATQSRQTLPPRGPIRRIPINNKEFKLLRTYLHDIWGIEVPPEKAYLFTTRLEKLLSHEGYASFMGFYDYLSKSNNTELQKKLIELMTTNETSFFRDRHPYETLDRKLLPLITSLPPIKDGNKSKIRIWSAGCSRGHEPYSIAITIKEWLKSQETLTEDYFSILATDISSNVLKEARSAIYKPADIEHDISCSIQKMYFTSENNSYTIGPEIRNMIDFAELNLAEPLEHLGKFHMIFCRNVLIYFSIKYKQKILNQFSNMLSDRGILLLGASESLFGITDSFYSTSEGRTTCYTPRRVKKEYSFV